jgi:hypothetical protein
VDSDIREIVTKSIETLLEDDDSDLVFSQAKLRQIWKCDNAFDFNYGHMVGLFEGLGMGLMQEREERPLTPAEMDEVIEIVQSYSMRLREKYLKYKNDPFGA